MVGVTAVETGDIAEEVGATKVVVAEATLLEVETTTGTGRMFI